MGWYQKTLQLMDLSPIRLKVSLKQPFYVYKDLEQMGKIYLQLISKNK
jgi:hypothetical protein